jgi:hypothetical protein
MATAIFLLGTAVSVKGQLDQAAAQRKAATAAEAQGRYNAQVAVNNMVAQQNDLSFEQSVSQLEKNTMMRQSLVARKNLSQKLTAELGKIRNRPKFGGSYLDVFKAAENQANTQLAEFDFDASQKTYEGFKQYQDSGRQMGLAYSLGMADRDLTLASAANQAFQFRQQASQAKLGAVSTAIGGFANAAEMSNNFGKGPMFQSKTPTVGNYSTLGRQAYR